MRSPRLRSALLASIMTLTLATLGCGTKAADGSSSTGAAPVVTKSVYEAPGPYPVGNTTITIVDPKRMGRTLRVEVWYPAAESARAAAEAGEPTSHFAAEGPARDQLAALVAAAPDPGTSRSTHSARDAAPADGAPFPIAAFSHCYDCARFSTFSIAERLASHGIAVVAPDHTGGTYADKIAKDDAPLNTAFLTTREADIAFSLDRVLDAAATELPATLRGRFDAKHVGVFGHSFGGVTAGLVLMKDPRPLAGLALCVPMENPLLQGVSMKAIHVPVFFLEAAEDNSIGAIGDSVIDQNFMDANTPVWKAQVADAGHWSVTNICGMDKDFHAGCSSADVRQTTGEPFTYLDIDEARGIAASYATAFFASTLLGDTAARDYLSQSRPSGVVTSVARK